MGSEVDGEMSFLLGPGERVTFRVAGDSPRDAEFFRISLRSR